MTMIFKTISPDPKPGRWSKPQATLNAKGQLKLSRVAFEVLGEPERVLVLFDRSSQTIALKKASRHETDTHECIAHGVHGKHGGRMIKIPGLLEHIETDLFTCMRFRNVRLDNHERLILELHEVKPAYHGERIGVFNEWRLRHDEAYAAKQREAYARRKEAKLAVETDEERATREDLQTREREYRERRRQEKARAREVQSRWDAETQKRRDLEQTRTKSGLHGFDY